MAGHSTGMGSGSAAVDRANHMTSELPGETASPSSELCPHSTLFTTYPLTASAVGATRPSSCLLGTGGGLLWGPLQDPTGSKVPLFTSLLPRVVAFPSFPPATVNLALSLDSGYSSLSWGRLVADFLSSWTWVL